MTAQVLAALLALALSASAPAAIVSEPAPSARLPAGVMPAPAAFAGAVTAFLNSPAPDFERIRGLSDFLLAAEPGDAVLAPLAEELRAAAQAIIDAPPGPAATEDDLSATERKLAVLNDPAFRNLLAPEQQRRAAAAFWAYNSHIYGNGSALGEKIAGIVRAMDASRAAPEDAPAPALVQDPAVAVEVVGGDAAKLKANALLSAVHSSGFCGGGINAVIERSGGSCFRRQLEDAKPLADGQTVVVAGDGKSEALFENVVFVVDDARRPLSEIVLKGLQAADAAGFKSVTLPALRTGWNFGLLEKTYEQVVAETVKGVNEFLKAGRKSVEKIALVVHQNPRLLSLFSAVRPADPEREALRAARLSGRGFSLAPRAKTVSPRRLRSPVVADLLKPWDVSRMLRRRRLRRIGRIEGRAAFSKPSVSVLNMPIKMAGTGFKIPAELEQFREFLQKIIDDQAAVNPRLDEFYAYLTVDSGFVKKGDYHRRPGIHIDGVQGSRYPEKVPPENTYSASDAVGTVFYDQAFDLRHIDPDRDYIHGELERQADEKNAAAARDYGIYHWDSYSAHHAAVADKDTPRTFVRVEFSKKVYDSAGDTVNPLFEYEWPRAARPIPYELNWYAEPLAKVAREKGRRANSVAIEFVDGTSPEAAKAIRASVRIRSAADVVPAVRALAREPSVARIAVSDKIAPVWDLVVDYPEIGDRTAFPEIGRPLDDRTVVEGSRKGGGLQPDFLIDHADPALRDRLLVPARAIGAKKLDDWAKLRELQALVRSALPGDGYREGPEKERYERFIAQAAGKASVSLGDYIRLGIGVCRETALLTVVALRAAGYKARFAYFKVFKDDGEFDQDHALALVEVGGTTYVLDSYAWLSRYYNGHRLADLLQPPADGRYPLAGPLAADNGSDPGRWRVVLNPFPRASPAR